MRCQCDKAAWDHSAGQCPATWGLRRFSRNGVELWLCWDCDLGSDVALDGETNGEES